MAEQHAAARALARVEEVPGPAAHHGDEAGNVAPQVRMLLEHRGDVGQRPQSHDGERSFAQGVFQIVHL